MTPLEYRLASAFLRLVRHRRRACSRRIPIGSSWRPPGCPPSMATCCTSTGPCARSIRRSTASCCWSPTATAWRASSPTSPGWCAACTTSRRPACSWSTTPTCRSTWPRTDGPRRSSRSGMPPARSSDSGSTPCDRSRSPSGPSCTATTTRSSSAVTGRAARTRPPCARRSSGWSRSAGRGPTSSSTTPQLAAARARVLAAYPALAGRRVVLYAPTFRGRGIGKRAAPGLDAARLRAALPADHVLVLKTHPNLDPAATPTDWL